MSGKIQPSTFFGGTAVTFSAATHAPSFLKHYKKKLSLLAKQLQTSRFKPFLLWFHSLLDIMGSNAYLHEATYLTRHLTLYSPKPFANDNKANACESNTH